MADTPMLRSRASILLLSLGVVAGAQTGAPLRPRISARVTMQLDSASTAIFDARAFDLSVSSAVNPAAEIQLVKNAGPQTGALLQLSANGAHVPSAKLVRTDDDLADLIACLLHASARDVRYRVDGVVRELEDAAADHRKEDVVLAGTRRLERFTLVKK